MSDALLHLTQQQLVDLAQQALAHHAAPSDRYRDHAGLNKNIKELPSATELENEILDLPVVVSHDGDEEAHAEIDSRAARLFARELESRFDDYTGYVDATFSAVKEEFLEDFSATLLAWKNFRLSNRGLIQIDQWWETARSLNLEVDARSKVIQHLFPSEASPWLEKAPALGIRWDRLWSSLERQAHSHAWASVLVWAPVVLKTNPLSTHDQAQRGALVSPAVFKKNAIDSLYAELVVAEAKETNQKQARSMNKLQALLLPYCSPSLSTLPWDDLLEGKPTRQNNWRDAIVSPEEMKGRLSLVFQRLAPHVNEWMTPDNARRAPSTGELTSSGKKKVSFAAVKRWATGQGERWATGQGATEIKMDSMQSLMDTMDQVMDQGTLYRNAFESAFLEARLESPTVSRSKPRF